MNPSTVPHTEIGLRLTICSEFLLNEEKPIEELYGSWMKRVGGRLIEFTEFEYWYDRFKNNQFDLGYDTNLDSKEVLEDIRKKDVSTMTEEKKAPVTCVEKAKEYYKLDLQLKEKNVPQVLQNHGENAVLGIPTEIQTVNDDRSGSSNDSNKENSDLGYDTSSDSKKTSKNQNTIDPEASGIKNDSAVIIGKEVPAEIVKRKTEDLKSNYQFKEEYVPETFQTLINEQSEKLCKIAVDFNEQKCTIKLDSKTRVLLNKKGNNWMISYKHIDTTIRTYNPEKSIVNHLWFVLRNPDIKLDKFEIYHHRNPELKLHYSQKLDFEEINTLLQSMFDSLDHQIQTSLLNCEKVNEKMCLTLLQNVKPGTLERINLDILWKEKGNYQKMKEIVETDQWKQAKRIASVGITPLKIDDLLHCEHFRLQRDRITPEDVLRVVEDYFNSIGSKYCTMFVRDKSVDIEAIMDILRSQNDGSNITEIGPISCTERFSFKIVKSVKFVVLRGSENFIQIQNYSEF